jgi:uncharacterized protein (DUF2147 family)
MIPILMLAAVTAAPHHSQVQGLWKNPSGSVILDIEPCHHHLCGTVKWASPKAKQDAKKGTPHLVGTPLLTNLKGTSHHNWSGTIFVPDMNMHASAKIHLVNHDHLKVSGCKLMICKSQTWTRSHHLPA